MNKDNRSHQIRKAQVLKSQPGIQYTEPGRTELVSTGGKRMQLLESMKEVLQEQFPNSRWSVSTIDSKQYLLSLEEFPDYTLPEDPQERVLVHLFEGEPAQIKVPSKWFRALLLKDSEGAMLRIAVCAESIYEIYPRKWELYTRPDWPEVEFHSLDQTVWIDRPAILVH